MNDFFVFFFGIPIEYHACPSRLILLLLISSIALCESVAYVHRD